MRLSEGAYANEAAISFAVVMPILRALGWDDSDPDQVMPEYASGGRRVDFALCGAGRRPSLFIEVKGVGRALDGDRQLFEYAFHEGIPLCLLTDGREWNFFLPSGQGNYDERRVYRLQLNERSPAECAQVLTRYLSHARVKSGDALEDATRDYRDIASKREAARNLPMAWGQLVDKPEDLLIELLIEQTEAICGFRPTSAEVVLFLKSLRIIQPDFSHEAVRSRDTSTSRKLLDQIEPDLEPRFTGGASSATRAVEYTFFGKRRVAPTASVAMIEILSEVARLHPNAMDAIATAVRGRSRNHIARTPAEIYPARPDLARAAEIAPGWLVGLNIANREKMRIIREACRVAGIKFGTEVIIDLPNADA